MTITISYDVCECDECIIFRYAIIDGCHLSDDEKLAIEHMSHDALTITKKFYDEVETGIDD